MKILRIAPDLYPDIIGGIGLHAHELSKAQVEKGHDVTVLTTKSQNIPQSSPLTNYTVKKFNTVFRPLGNPISPGMILEIMKRRNDFDIIHAHSHLYLTTNIASVVKRFGVESSLVITNHGLISQTAPLWIQKIYIPTFARFTLNSADAVICYTETEANKLIEIGISEHKVKVIPNGINTNRFYPRENKANSDCKKLLWVGRYVYGKGVEYLIYAFKKIINRLENVKVKLILVGDGPHKPKIVNLINYLELEDLVEIKSFVPNERMAELYCNADVFILPSLSEGVPRTILEAMSCGVPVITTNLPQLEGIIKNCGLFVQKKDSSALAEGILEILNNEELANWMGSNGVKKIYNNYSWDNSVEKTLKLYDQII